MFALLPAAVAVPPSLWNYGVPPMAGALAGTVAALVLYSLWKLSTLRKKQAAPGGRLRPPMLAVGTFGGAFAALSITRAARRSWAEPDWVGLCSHALLIAAIVAVTWLVVRLVGHAAERVLGSQPAERLSSRRRATQILMVRRVVVAVVCVAGAVAVVMTFPGARTVMASVLASAGLISLVAGLAAQSSLANLFAGLQLAFTDAVRVGDTVSIESKTGKVEEITLTYVVLAVWDGRHVIVPSTLFIKTHFENVSRHSEAGTAPVFLDLNWDVPVGRLRAELESFVHAHDLWDGNECSAAVTDAKGGNVEVRILVSAATPGELWTLRCAVREHLVAWVQQNFPSSLPRTRIERADV